MSFKNLFVLLSLMVALSACDKKASQEANPATQEEAVKAEPEAVDAPDGDAGGPPPPFYAKGVVAIINGKNIEADAFNEKIKPLAPVSLRIPDDQLNNMKDDIVSKLIDDTLIRQRLGDRLDKVSPEQITREKDEFKKQFPNEEVMKMMLEQSGLSKEDFDEQLKVVAALRSLLVDEYGAGVTDEEVQSNYDTNKETQYTRKDQVHARHILLNLAKDAPKEEEKKVLAKAKEIEKEAKAKDADFAKLAEKYSEGPTKSNGGDLGFFERERMVPEFSKAAFAMKVGEVSKPVRSNFGYHIIKVEEKKDAGVIPFDEVKDDIRAMLEMNKMAKEMDTVLKELRSKATIERKDGDNVVPNPKFKAFKEAADKNNPAAALPQGLPLGDQDLKLELKGLDDGAAPAEAAPAEAAPTEAAPAEAAPAEK